MGGGIYDGTYPATDPFLRAAMADTQFDARREQTECPGTGCGAELIASDGFKHRFACGTVVDRCGESEPEWSDYCLRRQLAEAEARIETLAAALRDFAEHGGRFEAQPCLLMRQIDGTFYMQAEMAHDYLRRFDAGIRERAKRTLAAMGVEVVGRG